MALSRTRKNVMTILPSTGSCVCVVVFLMLFYFSDVDGFRLTGGTGSFAQFPIWNGCPNASFSFEFRTTQRISSKNVTLWYVDDRGKTDFFAIMLVASRRVRLVLQLADTSDDGVEIELGHEVNDGRWHRVEVRRKRAETFLYVDDEWASGVVFGEHFHFGQQSDDADGGNPSNVYFGGVPSHYSAVGGGRLHELAMPSIVFIEQFVGSVRNMVYGNCTCRRARTRVLGGRIDGPPSIDDVCEERNPCRDGCLCLSSDEGPTCDCKDLFCVGDVSVHYMLPMDALLTGNRIANPSGLDARTQGYPPLVRGPRRNAILLSGKENHVRVSGPAHRHECFGDLDKCPLGYTIGMWVNFTQVANRKPYVYMSNGGHTTDSHGVAMTYDGGTLEFRFRRKDGNEWTVRSDNVLPSRWYHVLVTWDAVEGLTMYLNGDPVDRSKSPRLRPSTAVPGSGPKPGTAAAANIMNEFIIGRPNDKQTITERHPMAVDEFNFWSTYKNESEVKDLGAFYRFYTTMESLDRDNQLKESNMAASVIAGNPDLVAGPVGRAIRLDGRRRDVIQAGPTGMTCLGNLSLCANGLTSSMWIKFDELEDGAQYFSTGNDGLALYYRDGRLVATAKSGNKNWATTWAGPETGEWYFVELSWEPETGLKMYVDLNQVGADARGFMSETTGTSDAAGEVATGNLHLGSDGGDMTIEGKRYASATIDELEFWYGERSKLIELDFLSRGRPTKYNVAMDSMTGSRIAHPSLRIDTFGQPVIVPDGRIAGALQLNGNGQYASFGRQHVSCFGNLDLCRHGMLLATWIRPGQMRDGMDFVSSGSNGIKARYVDGKLKVTAKTSTREWNVETDEFLPDRWQYLEIGWSEQPGGGEGLELYLNNRLVARATIPLTRFPSPDDQEGIVASKPEKEQFQLGRGDGTQPNSRYGNMSVDDFEYWYGNRRYLLAFDYIPRGRPPMYLVDMNSIVGTTIPNSNLVAEVHGNPAIVPGKIGGAVRLDGVSNQYVDMGSHPKSCFGNLMRCRHGVTGSMWLNFRETDANQYYMTSGGGIRMFHNDGKLHVTADLPDQHWEAVVPNLQKDHWYFVEYTWHPEKGLDVFINNILTASSRRPTTVRSRGPSDLIGGNVLVGAANPTETDQFTYANGLVDEFETWFRHRDNLVAFDYIMRGNVTHVSFPFEVQRGNVIAHPDIRVIAHNGATLVPGRVGNAVHLEGSGEYVTLGDQGATCMGNLDLCPNGLTIGFDLKVMRMLRDGYVLSSGAYSVYTKDDGKLYAKFHTPTRTWEVSTPDDQLLSVGKWQRVELSWDPEDGLGMYVKGNLIDQDKTPTIRSPSRVTDRTVYVGRPTDDNLHGRYADAVVDELDVWYADRDRLVTLGLLEDDIRKINVDMDSIVSDVVVNKQYVIYAVNNPQVVPAVIKNGIYLDGTDQYIEMPLQDKSSTICHNDLRLCAKGFTMRMKVKPDQVTDGIYYVSSPFVDVFQQSGRTVAELRSPTTVWRTVGPALRPGEWSQVDVTWHPSEGMSLLMDGQVVDRQISGVSNSESYSDLGSFYVGRATKETARSRYAHGTFDDVQLYEVKRDYLISEEIINPDEDNAKLPRISTSTTAKPSRSTSTTPSTATGSATSFPDVSKLKPVTFHGDGTQPYLRIPLNDSVTSLELQFQTVEPRGLVLYAANPVTRDSVGVEIFDGLLYAMVDIGPGPARKYQLDSGTSSAASPGRVDDGQPHRLWIGMGRGGVIRMQLDDSPERTIRLSSSGVGGGSVVQPVDFGAELFIGGTNEPDGLPWSIWSRGDNYQGPQRTFGAPPKFYRGCVWSLTINNAPVELTDHIRRQTTGVERGCQSMPANCTAAGGRSLCEHLGRCNQHWKNHVCDCRDTAFTGRACSRVAPILSLDGSGFVEFDLPGIWLSHTNDFSVRFKTQRPDGLIFVTSNERNNRYLKLSLDNGRGIVETNIDGQRRPVQLYFECPESVSDGQWHTVYVRRRANALEACFTNCTCQTTEMFGERYTLDIDHVYIGGRGEEMQQEVGPPFVGLLQNFVMDDQLPFDSLADAGGTLPPGAVVGIGGSEDGVEVIWEESGPRPLYVATFRGRLAAESYSSVDTLQIVGDTRLGLMLRTSSGDLSSGSDGMLLYSGGSAGYNASTGNRRQQRSDADYFVIEMVDGGRIRMGADDGGGDRSVMSKSPSLADGRWHNVDVLQTGPRAFTINVDNRYSDVLTMAPTRNTLDLVGDLYIGGVPSALYGRLPQGVRSTRGFTGCMATVVINERLIDVLGDARTTTPGVSRGCTNTTLFCTPGLCKHFGVCREHVGSFRCDCNMTSFAGPTCNDEAEGFWYGIEPRGRGITVFQIRPPRDTSVDNIAFGFMTWYKDGTLLRIDGDGGHFFEAQLVGGHVVVTYNVGKGVQRLVENSRQFNDANYHYVRFTRTGDNAVLNVDDDLEKTTTDTAGPSSTLFRGMKLVTMGGNLDARDQIINRFNGIIAGVYINGYRVIDMANSGEYRTVASRGDVQIASHYFYVPPPPDEPEEPKSPEDEDGFGVKFDGGSPAGGAAAGGNAEAEPRILTGSVFSLSVSGSDVGTRAAAVAGSMLGILAAVLSLAWAVNQFKPGLLGALKGAAGGGAGAGGGGLEMKISSPMSAASLSAKQNTPLLVASNSASSEAANGYGPPAVEETTFIPSVNLANYFAPMTSASPQTTTLGIQTDAADEPIVFARAGSSMAVGSSAVTRSRDELAFGSAMGSGYGLGWSNAGTQTGPPPGYASEDMIRSNVNQVSYAAYGSQQVHADSSQGYYSAANSTMDASYQQQQQQQLLNSRSMARSPTPMMDGGYQMRNMVLSQQYQQLHESQQLMVQQQQQTAFYSGNVSNQATAMASTSSLAVGIPNLMAAEEIRVDCIRLTNNGRYVVTGSIHGPPQVWDMKTGNLVKVMAGEDLSSTDLHLANGDTLLVGQVAELTQVDPSDESATMRLHHRKLQIWDFDTGRPLQMRQNELCTASCMMNNGEHIVLGRTDRFGSNTTVVVWDVLGNEPLRQLRYDACLGLADHISFLQVSTDDRFIVAGVQNSLDGAANFVVYDLQSSTLVPQQPKVLAIDALAEVTVVLDSHEAVTGTRTGELTVWSLATGKAVRRLGGGGSSADCHTGEVTSLTLSKDRSLLVSTSADRTVKVWNLETERPIHTFRSHTDEVLCATISNDNELVVSGSLDGTIRLWRTTPPEVVGQVAAINVGVDVFRVLLSNNKRTIVALADRKRARKLVMLQIVRSTRTTTRTSSTIASGATSPMAATTPLTPQTFMR